MAMRNRVEFLRPWALLAALVAPSVALAGPITLNTALPVHDGELIVRQEVMWIRSTGDPSPLNMNLNVIAAPAILYYGVNADLALLGVLPFLHKQVAVTTPMGRVTRSTNGFGDMMVAARYPLLALDRPGETFRIAPFPGAHLPPSPHNEAPPLR